MNARTVAGVAGDARTRRRGVLALASCVLVATTIGFIAQRTPVPDATSLRAGVVTPEDAAGRDARTPTSAASGHADGAPALASAQYAVRTHAVLRAHWERLVREGDARQRLLALQALTAGSRDLAARRRARALAAAALAEAPDDPLVARMQAWFCDDRPHECTPAQLDAWARLEPGNAAALGGALARAQGEPARVDALMAQAAGGGRYESHHHELMLETVASFDGVAWPPLSAEARRRLAEAGIAGAEEAGRRVLVMGRVHALPAANLAGIARACRPPLASTRARDCRIVLIRMTGATTLLERSIAYSLLARLTAGTPEGAHWHALNRRHLWRMSQFSAVTPGDAYWTDLLRLGEVEAMHRAILAAGRRLDPPPGWRAPGT